MSKKCMPLWREAHFQVKMHKAPQCRTTFGSSDVEKCARRCGAKHISNSKCTKKQQVRSTFGSSDVEKVHAVVARSTFRSENIQNTTRSDHFWKLRCRFAASLHYSTLRHITPHSTLLHYITLHYAPQHYNYNCTTRLHSTLLNFTTLHYTTLRTTTLH